MKYKKGQYILDIGSDGAKGEIGKIIRVLEDRYIYEIYWLYKVVSRSGEPYHMFHKERWIDKCGKVLDDEELFAELI